MGPLGSRHGSRRNILAGYRDLVHSDDADQQSQIRAVFFDLGGVVLTSPFEAFTRLEEDRGWPDGAIVRINSTNPDDNAWAQMERGEIDANGFVTQFEAEGRAIGLDVDGAAVLGCLVGSVRPDMAAFVVECAAQLTVAVLTNNTHALDSTRAAWPEGLAAVIDAADHVFESSVLGIRKPDPGFYRHALDVCGVSPDEVLFLDDLGMNLKPARALGMHTIKVEDPQVAIDEARSTLGSFAVR